MMSPPPLRPSRPTYWGVAWGLVQVLGGAALWMGSVLTAIRGDVDWAILLGVWAILIWMRLEP